MNLVMLVVRASARHRNLPNSAARTTIRSISAFFASLRFSWLLLFLPGLILAAEPDAPESERAAFKLREGYEVNLFASEADGVTKPIQMRFDPQGRLWVACSTIYPQLKPGQKPEDKI